MGVLADLVQDLRYALRAFLKAPAFTATAILTLAVGIGTTVGTFTIVNTVLLQPLPVRAPGELAVVEAQSVTTQSIVLASWTKYRMVRDTSRVFADIAAYSSRELAFSDGKSPEQVPGARVTWNFFKVLGVSPARGRPFQRQDDIDNVESAAPVAIVTDGFLQRHFDGDRSAVVGRSAIIEGRPTTIVGVLPPGFRFQFTDREPQIYLTAVFTPGAMTAAQVQGGAGFLQYFGRVNPGTPMSEVVKDLAAIDGQYRGQFGSYVDASRFRLHATPFTDNLVGDVRPGLVVLMGAVALVLLIACANVAHLLLARAASRQHEIGVRLAIGASRSRLVRQFLTESFVLSAAGCVLGWWAIGLVVDVLIAKGPANIPRLKDVRPDTTVLAFAALVSVITSIIFGLVPALRASRVRVGDVLKDERSGGLTGRSAGRLHRLLAVSETAVTVALLIAAGLLFQSFVRMQRVNMGFEPGGVYAAQVALPRAKYSQPSQREAFFTQLLDALRNQPGFATTGAVSYLPASGSNYGFFFYLEEAADRDAPISVRHVGGEYFRAMHIPLREGRLLDDRDDSRSMPVAVINESAARHYFGGADPIGRRIASTSDRILREIVGVVGDVRFNGPAKSTQDELYLSYRQVPWPSMSMVVSSTLTADQVIAALRHQVALLDPDQAVADIRPMTTIVSATTAQQQFTSGLLGVFALLATTLAVIGLYGVTTLFVTQRRYELGIRMALGARAADVLALVMTEGARMITLGATLGLAIAFASRRVLAGLLFGVTASDVTTYFVGAAFVCLVGLVACLVPARRAIALDPIRALRQH